MATIAGQSRLRRRSQNLPMSAIPSDPLRSNVRTSDPVTR